MGDFSVFISYSHNDGRDFAERLNGLIRSVFSDIDVFWDKELIAGEYVWDKLLEEVRLCDVFLYLVSDRSIKLPSGCIREFAWARMHDKHIVPCILSSYSGNPDKIEGFPELNGLLYVDLRNGIDSCTIELAKLYGTIYESILNASPITQYHRREMMLLYEILGKFSDEKDEEKVGWEVYQRGFELEYDDYPNIDGRVPKAVCLEVIDILDMMVFVQEALNSVSDKEKKNIEESVGKVDYMIKNVGFCGNHETTHLSYLRFLNRDGRFQGLSYDPDNGNSHLPNLSRYREMLQEFNYITHDFNNDFYQGRYELSVNELIQIVQAPQFGSSHPL